MYPKFPVFLRGSDAVAVVLALALVFFMAGGRLSRPDAAAFYPTQTELSDFRSIGLAPAEEA